MLMDATTERLFKFVLIIICFLYSFTEKDGLAKGKKDAYILRFALGLTVAADFLMVLFDIGTAAVLTFCIVQAAHNYRFTNAARVKTQFIIGAVTFVIAFFISGKNILIASAASYSVFLLYSLTGSFITYKSYPFPNNILIVLGMLLFTGCDIAVLLYNFPADFFKEPSVSMFLSRAIWVCYLPAQAFLSSSAKKIITSEDEEEKAGR